MVSAANIKQIYVTKLCQRRQKDICLTKKNKYNTNCNHISDYFDIYVQKCVRTLINMENIRLGNNNNNNNYYYYYKSKF